MKKKEWNEQTTFVYKCAGLLQFLGGPYPMCGMVSTKFAVPRSRSTRLESPTPRKAVRGAPGRFGCKILFKMFSWGGVFDVSPRSIASSAQQSSNCPLDVPGWSSGKGVGASPHRRGLLHQALLFSFLESEKEGQPQTPWNWVSYCLTDKAPGDSPNRRQLPPCPPSRILSR